MSKGLPELPYSGGRSRYGNGYGFFRRKNFFPADHGLSGGFFFRKYIAD